MTSVTNSFSKQFYILYGTEQLSFEVPDGFKAMIIQSRDLPAVADLDQAVREVLEKPFGSPRISESAYPHDKVVIVINDITRPAFSGLLVRHILRELARAGVSDRQVTVLVATGTHRPNNSQELAHMIGPDLIERVRVVNHDCRDTTNLVKMGVTAGGTLVVINRLYAEASFRILTGTITPHHAAGFSGGRKSVIPGLAGLETLKRHHSLEVRPYDPAIRRLENNLFHSEAVAAVRMAGVNFIANVVPNSKGEVVAVVAGEMERAHLQGVKICQQMSHCPVPVAADIVITGPGGYPRDINLYQSQKAAAETVVKDGGTIILAASCPEGIGNDDFADWMIAASSPLKVINREEGFVPGANKAFMFSRALIRSRLIVVSPNLSESLLNKFMERALSLQEALERAGNPHGSETVLAVIPRTKSSVRCAEN